MVGSAPSPAPSAIDPQDAALFDGLETGSAPRVGLDRAQRDATLAAGLAARRARDTVGLLALDALWTGLWLFLGPFVDWETPWNPTVGWTLLAGALLGTFILGGFRVGRSGTDSTPARAAAGSLLGLSGAWLVLKFLGTKLKLRLLRPPAAEGMVLLALLALVWCLGSRLWLLARRRRRLARAKTLVLGDVALVERVSALLAEHGARPPLGFALEPGTGSLPLADLAQHVGVDVRAIVLGAPPNSLPDPVLAELVHLQVVGVPVRSMGELVEELEERTPLGPDRDAWFLQDSRLQAANSPVYLGIKRLVDVVGSLLLLSATLPLLIVAALAIKLSGPGPIVFKQVRLGQWKRPFTIYKLRSMVPDAEIGGARWASRGDPRITAVGQLLRKSRIDELPQLVNVLQGHMSLVGPRPERPEFVARLEDVVPWYDLRYLVKPGLTGWAQVRHPYGGSVDETLSKLEYDVYYVKNASPAFDLRILALTPAVVLTLQGQ